MVVRHRLLQEGREIMTDAERAKQVRDVLNGIAAAMHGDRPQRHAFRQLAELADDESLARLGRALR